MFIILSSSITLRFLFVHPSINELLIAGNHCLNDRELVFWNALIKAPDNGFPSVQFSIRPGKNCARMRYLACGKHEKAACLSNYRPLEAVAAVFRAQLLSNSRLWKQALVSFTQSAGRSWELLPLPLLPGCIARVSKMAPGRVTRCQGRSDASLLPRFTRRKCSAARRWNNAHSSQLESLIRLLIDHGRRN